MGTTDIIAAAAESSLLFRHGDLALHQSSGMQFLVWHERGQSCSNVVGLWCKA